LFELFFVFFKQKKRVAKARPLGNAQNISGKIPNKKERLQLCKRSFKFLKDTPILF